MKDRGVRKEMRCESMSATLRYMFEQPDMPLTVANFVQLNWFGEKTLADLEGEELIEVQDFQDAVANLEETE